MLICRRAKINKASIVSTLFDYQPVYIYIYIYIHTFMLSSHPRLGSKISSYFWKENIDWWSVTEIMFPLIQIFINPQKYRPTCVRLGVKSLFNYTFDGGSTAPKETDSTRLEVPKSTYWGRLLRPSAIWYSMPWPALLIQQRRFPWKISANARSTQQQL